MLEKIILNIFKKIYIYNYNCGPRFRDLKFVVCNLIKRVFIYITGDQGSGTCNVGKQYYTIFRKNIYIYITGDQGSGTGSRTFPTLQVPESWSPVLYFVIFHFFPTLQVPEPWSPVPKYMFEKKDCLFNIRGPGTLVASAQLYFLETYIFFEHCWSQNFGPQLLRNNLCIFSRLCGSGLTHPVVCFCDLQIVTFFKLHHSQLYFLF